MDTVKITLLNNGLIPFIQLNQKTGKLQIFPPFITAQNKGLQGKKARWVTKTELKDRRKGKRCIRYNRTGYTLQAYPLLPLKRPTTAISSITITYTDIEEKDKSENEET